MAERESTAARFRRLAQFHPDAVLATGHDASDEPVLAVDEIQGNILPGFGTTSIRLLGLKIVAGADSQVIRDWLKELSPYISSLRQVNAVREVRRAVARSINSRPQLPDVLLNIALAYSALTPLGLASDNIIEGAFIDGMAATNLQDPQDENGIPLNWKVGATPATTPDILLILGSDDETAIDLAAKEILASLAADKPVGLELIYQDNGSRLADEKEHFGFRDGISQPGVRGRFSERADHVLTRRYFEPSDRRAHEFAKPGQPLLWPGQFIFGYPIQLENRPEAGPVANPPHEWMKFGSYLAFRRLRQDVPAFRRFAREQAQLVSRSIGRTVNEAELQAWLVGRWPDGTPLTRSPHHPDAEIANDDMLNNFFGYDADEENAIIKIDGEIREVVGVAQDRAAIKCPHFAHIRKVNLRDKLTDQGPSVKFRILRRGITFGPPFDENELENIDRGLLFISYQRILDPQFLTLTTTWMNSHDAPEGFGHDLLVGQNRTGRFAERLDADGQVIARLNSPAAESWVIPTGGAFFFCPAKSVFANL